MVKFFFEIHNPEQIDGQGPDIGPQYISAIFYGNRDEKRIAKETILSLKKVGMRVVTKLIDATQHRFYKAEEEHQNYYKLRGGEPYCHSYRRLF